jgi:hypothetical protein
LLLLLFFLFLLGRLTPQQRTLRAQIGAASLHAQGKTNTAPAREALKERFERQVDPDGVLDPAERARRAAHARRAHMLSLSLKSAKRRSRAS